MKRWILILVALSVVAFPMFGTHAGEGVPGQKVAHEAEKTTHKVAHPTEDHGEGHAAPKTYFGMPGWVLKTLNMIVFVSVLWYLLRGPVGGALRQRRETIRSQLAEAKVRRAKADQLASDIQSRLTAIESDVDSVLARARVDGERQKQELIEAGRQEAAKILVTARHEVDARMKQARKELTEYAAELSTRRAQGLLEASITDADRKDLFDESLRQVKEMGA